MSIIEKIKRHIEDEKQLAAYKIAILKSGDQKGYKKRLIMKEEDFIKYDFSKINFSSLEELRSALLLFKASRESFDMKYGDSKKISLEKVSYVDLEKTKEKIKYLEDKCKWILDFKIKEINIVENKTLQSLVKNIPDNIDSLDISKIKKIEGSLIGKKRARIQLLTFCFAKYMFLALRDISLKLEAKDLLYEDLRTINKNIDNIFSGYKNKYYQYFNSAIQELPMLLMSSKGENDYVSLIHPLVNITNSIDKFYISKISPKEDVVFDDAGKFINKKSSMRSYGINTNIKRIGNETVDPFYIEIFSENGNDLTNIFEKSFFNNSVNGEYFKSLSLLPLQDVKSLLNNEDFDHYFKDNDYNKEAINSGSVNNVFLSKENSIILVAETRSDSEHLNDSEKIVELLINNIRNDYRKKFDIIIDMEEEDCFYNREKILKRFLEPR